MTETLQILTCPIATDAKISSRCVSIARAHSLLSADRESLALLSRAMTLLSQALPVLSSISKPPTDVSSLSAADGKQPPLHLEINPVTANSVHSRLRGELTRQHALVDLTSHLLSQDKPNAADPIPPLIETLDQYPIHHGRRTSGVANVAASVDLANLVTYPPKLEPVPVKPLFLDIAWNYIDYPGRQRPAPAAGPSAAASGQAASGTDRGKEKGQAKEPAKRGWFSFGRS